jgi:phosphoglycolate phosphatase
MEKMGMVNIFWDLDGTLIDSKRDILHYLELAMCSASLDITCQIKPFRIGPPVDIMLKEAFPPMMLSEKKLNEVISNFRRLHNNSGFPTTMSFDGIGDIISDVACFTHYIVTNKPNPASEKIVKKLGWENKIASIKTQSLHINQRKSKTQLFSELIAEVGGDKSSFIGVGDVREDCIAAKNNGVTAIGVLWGFGTREELMDCCDYLFENTKQLRDFLYEKNVQTEKV